jgi:ABC-type transport system substrate-binding protein
LCSNLEEGRKKFNPEFVKKIKATEKKKSYYLSPEQIENEMAAKLYQAQKSADVGASIATASGISPTKMAETTHAAEEERKTLVLQLENALAEKEVELQNAIKLGREDKISQLFVEGAKELDREKRRVIYNEAQQLISENLPFIYLVNPYSLGAVRNCFEGIEYSALGGAFWNLDELKKTCE